MDLWLESIRIAWRTLRGHPLRTALVAFSVAIGSGGISLLVSVGKSGVDTIFHSAEQVGGGRLMFLYEDDQVKDKPSTYDGGITLADISEVRAQVPGLKRISFLNAFPEQLVFGNQQQAEADIAVGSDWLRLNQQKIIFGTSIPDDKEHNDVRVVVLAKDLAEKLYGSATQAVGATLTLWAHHYTVVGVADGTPAPGFNMGGAERTRAVYLSPYAATTHEGMADRADNVIIESDGTVSHDLQMRLIDAILLSRHRTVDWAFFDLEPLMSKFETIFLVLRVIIGFIAAIALFIAGAGVMNVLLASVRERVTEIGVRRAIGASKRDIRRQFLVESAALAILGGGVGVTLGSLLAFGVGQAVVLVYPIWQTRVSIGAAIAGILMTLACGVVFGLLPARRASKLDVVACLRGEA